MLKYFVIIILLLSNSLKLAAQRFYTDVFSSVDSTVNIQYGSATDYQGLTQSLLLDFYEPANDLDHSRPLIIYVHGGGFTSGSRKLQSIKMICEKMARKGYALASIDYRLDPNFNVYNSNNDRRAMTDGMHDVRAAIRFFRANQLVYKIDTANIIIGGESAGAAASMMASYVDKQSELWAYPGTNPNDVEGNSGNPGFSSDSKATFCLCGLMIDTLAIEGPQDNPFLWVHGSADQIVPMWFADIINKRATNVGLYHQRFVFEGATHCPWYYTLPNWQTYLDSTVNYLTNFLYPRVTGMHSDYQKPGVELHPNPVSDVLLIKLTGINKGQIRICNSLGKTVWSGSVESSEIEVSTSNLEQGLYFLQYSDSVEYFTWKIIKN